jgi:hypothetical protein
MSEELGRVLAMLVDGKISVENAQQVIEALNTASDPEDDDEYAWQPEPIRPRFLRIRMHRPASERHLEKDVNIRVPIAVVCGGMRLGMLMPGIGNRINARLRARGVDFDLGRINEEQIESFLSRLGQLTIDVTDGGQQKQLRITCE